jgi:hypothetical protein
VLSEQKRKLDNCEQLSNFIEKFRRLKNQLVRNFLAALQEFAWRKSSLPSCREKSVSRLIAQVIQRAIKCRIRKPPVALMIQAITPAYPIAKIRERPKPATLAARRVVTEFSAFACIRLCVRDVRAKLK